MTRVQAVETTGARRIEARGNSPRQERPPRLELEELDQRLEAAFFSNPDFLFHTNEPCVWACACFLVDGSQR